MRIHHGDDGLTEAFGGTRVSKASPSIQASGDLDELNAFLGAVIPTLPEHCADIKAQVIAEQKFLFVIGAVFYEGCEDATLSKIMNAGRVLGEESERLEDETGGWSGFEAPGGCAASIALNIARAVCRRAERSAVAVLSSSFFGFSIGSPLIAYLNRLSNYLYYAGRAVNARAGKQE
jgi:cob(I)alamin adenosyltransferase